MNMINPRELATLRHETGDHGCSRRVCVEDIRMRLLRELFDPSDDTQIEPTFHADQSNLIFVEATKFGELARLQAGEMGRDAEIR